MGRKTHVRHGGVERLLSRFAPRHDISDSCFYFYPLKHGGGLDFGGFVFGGFGLFGFITVSKAKEPRHKKTRTTTRTKPVAKAQPKPKDLGIPKPVLKFSEKIQQTMMAVILDEKFKQLKETHVGELANELQNLNKGKVLILDGVVTQRLIDIAEDRGIELIIGVRIGNIVKKPAKMRIHTFDEL